MDGFSFSVNLNGGFSFFCSSLILLLLLLLLLLLFLLLLLSFLHSLFGRVEPLLEELKGLVSLSPAQSGIGMPDLKGESSEQFNASLDIIALHVNSIVTQSSTTQHEICSKRCSRQGTREPVRGWTLFQSKNMVFLWTSRSLGTPFSCLCYDLPLSNLPSYCAYGEMFNVNHALSCKKGGFIAQRHDTTRDHLTSHMSKGCRNVDTEPLLQPLDNEIFNLKSTVTSQEARLDMKAGGFGHQE